MFTNADITLYSCSKDGKYTRSVIHDVFWDEVKQSNIIRSGLITADSVKIFIPVKNIPSGVKFTTGRDLVIKGITEFEFNNTSQQTISASLATLKADHDKVVIVSVVDDKTYGSPSMQHYEISCK
jgi:hypothetical protein